jgi:hypothetical protein
LTALSLAVPVLSLGAMRASGNPDEPKQSKSIRLVIDYGDGVEKHFTAIAWKKDMTVLDAMNEAKAGPRGIAFRFTGAGATAFLTKIDDLENEGGGAGKRNWLYWVNKDLGDKSFGAYKLEASDVVTWKFTARKLSG